MKKKLLKSINEMYFRNFQNTKMNKLSNEPSKEELEYLLAIADDLDTEMFYAAHDLFEVMYGNFKDTFTPLSQVAITVLEDEKFLEQQFAMGIDVTWAAGMVAGVLKELSNESYFVGGCVRDACMRKTPKDIDFCTDTPVAELVEVFTKAGFKCDEVGLQFLVLVVSIDGESFEIANFRKDKDNTGGEIGTMFDDGKRRDFTVNTGYVRISDFRLFDPNEQFVDDIMSRTLRFVGKAKDRLDEDPIRAMRFYRFMTRGFTADKKSLQAVRERMQNDSKRMTQLQRVLELPGVAEAIETERNSNPRGKLGLSAQPKVTMTAEQLSQDLLQLERMRLEVEKMVGL